MPLKPFGSMRSGTMTGTRSISSGVGPYWPFMKRQKNSEGRFSKMNTVLSIPSDKSSTLIYGISRCDDYGSNYFDGYSIPGETVVASPLWLGEFRPVADKTICDSTGLFSELDRVAPVDTDHIFLFMRLVDQWHIERKFMSSLSDIVSCASYTRIIGMGAQALPLILIQMKNEGDDPDYWFVALEAITGQNPVPEDALGDTVKMAQAWLLWAATNDV